MKKHKRDINERVFQRGYRIGLAGKSADLCPYEKGEIRFQWITGWRQGRTDQWDGLTGVNNIARTSASTQG